MIEHENIEVQDSVLITQAKRGDHAAFGLIYERYVDPIFRYLRSRVADVQTAEDLTEDVFVRSYEALERYQDKGLRYSAYLYQVARNLLVDHYRQVDDSVPLESAEQSKGEPRSTDEEIIFREQVAQLQEAMDHLSEEYQEIIRLRILMEMPTAGVAEWLNRSEGATRVLLHRALKALKREVDSRDESRA